MLSQRLAAFDRTLSVDEPKLYAKLNTVINQLYDNNKKYKTGILYMNSKRPDLFVYSGLKLGINIISVVQSGVTVHHSFIYNMGNVSVIMDSWAHGNHRGYIFGRELITRIWVTTELEALLNNLHPGRPRSFPSMKNALIRVFLAPHSDNITHYPQFVPDAVSKSEVNLYFAELKKTMNCIIIPILRLFQSIRTFSWLPSVLISGLQMTYCLVGGLVGCRYH
jgi:hypothetical protein